jgi:putative ABC transport system substrate-binding protein
MDLMMAIRPLSHIVTRPDGGAAAWPVVGRAQGAERVRRIGVLGSLDENDADEKLRLSALMQALAEMGWIVGRNVRMDLRWAGSDSNRMRALAKELVGLQPEIIVTTPSTPAE